MSPGEIDGHLEANIYVARGVFNHEILRIHLSDLDKELERQSLGIRWGSVWRACSLKCWARSPAAGQVASHGRISWISWLEIVRQAQLTAQMPRGPRWRAMMTAHDSQSYPASVLEAKLVEYLYKSSGWWCVRIVSRIRRKLQSFDSDPLFSRRKVDSNIFS